MPARYQDLTGKLFGKLQVLSITDRRTTDGTSVWLCVCSCGNFTTRSRLFLLGSPNPSCGCYRIKPKGLLRHGMYNTRLYRIWEKMKGRVNNPKEAGYEEYGGRGITYDANWQHFEGFYEDMHDTYADNLYLDRINPDGNYCKENCRWVDASMNAFNQRVRNTNKSGHSGIYKDSRGKFRTGITVNYKFHHLGYFDKYEDALDARLLAEKEFFGEHKLKE